MNLKKKHLSDNQQTVERYLTAFDVVTKQKAL